MSLLYINIDQHDQHVWCAIGRIVEVVEVLGWVAVEEGIWLNMFYVVFVTVASKFREDPM